MLKDLDCLDSNAQIMPQQKRMSATTKRVYGGNKAVLHTNSSEQTNTSKSESTFRWKWRLWLRCGENRMEMVQRAAGKPAAYFVFVVLIMAEFLNAKLEFMVVAFFKAWRRAVSDFFLACSFGLLERSTDNSTRCVHRIHTCSVHHEHYNLLTSTDHVCACGSRA